LYCIVLYYQRGAIHNKKRGDYSPESKRQQVTGDKNSQHTVHTYSAQSQSQPSHSHSPVISRRSQYMLFRGTLELLTRQSSDLSREGVVKCGGSVTKASLARIDIRLREVVQPILSSFSLSQVPVLHKQGG